MKRYFNSLISVLLSLILLSGCVIILKPTITQPVAKEQPLQKAKPQELPIENLPITKDFTLSSIKGDIITLSNYRHKKGVILFFWATWCPFCRAEIKQLSKHLSDLKSNDIEVLAIDIGEAKSQVEKFLKNSNIAFPVLLDTTSSTAELYEVQGIPTYFLLDAKGNIKFTDHSFPEDYKALLSK